VKQILNIRDKKLSFPSYILLGSRISLVILAILYLFSQRQIKPFYLFSSINVSFLFLLLIFSIGNWFLEIKKWQGLTHSLQPLSFNEATRQALISFAVSLVTPNRIGEYGAKALFYPRKDHKKILFLNLAGNILQQAITLIFGVVAIIFLVNLYPKLWENHISLSKLSAFLLLSIGIVFLYIFLKKKIKMSRAIQKCPCQQTFILSFLRYLLFSIQFAFIWIYIHHAYLSFSLFLAIYLTYFFSSIIPIISFFDWAIKGSIALYIFSILGLKSEYMLSVTALMWTMNFFIPFLIGSILFIYNKKIFND
jgi:hypothetical protein